MSPLLSRKFLISILALLLTYSLVLLGKLDTQSFMTVLLGVTGIYATSNVANKMVVK